MDDSHQADIEAVLAKRHDNGADHWATPDGRLGVGSPFSTLESLQILHELSADPQHPVIAGALQRILDAWKPDGRYQLAPGAIYPCHTANTTRVLCRFGLASDQRVQTSLACLLDEIHGDGGWRCNRVALGRNPDTDRSNPGVTLFALDALRFMEQANRLPVLERAVETLLEHWRIRRPLGPCEFGIGSLFMQTEYPFLRYNLFSYVYVLSFYDAARGDVRFTEALAALQAKLDHDGQLIIERPNRQLAGLQAFRKGKPSQPATRRYQEILANLA